MRRPALARLLLAGLSRRGLRRSALGFGGVFRDPAYVDGELGDGFVKPSQKPHS